MRARLLLPLALAGLLLACSREEPAPKSLAQYIPADTPYAFVSLEPGDPALNRAWVKAFGGPEMLSAARDMLDRLEAMAKDEEDRKGLAVARALLAEFGPFFDPEQPTPMGLAEATEIALYGHGLLPVLRIRLADPVAFEAAVTRIEQAVGKAMTVAEVGGRTVRRQVLDDEVVVYLAVVDDQAVLSFTPLAVDEQVRGELLGLTPPAESLANGPLLEELVQRHGLVRQAGVGFVDTQRMVQTLLAPQRPADRELLKDDEDQAPLDAVCQAEVKAMAAQFPRAVFGGTRMDAKAMDSLLVLELAPEWATQWAAVTSPQPGAGRAEDALVWFGFGLDPIKAGTLLGKVADRVIAEPYQCAELADLNQAMQQMKEGLNPMVIGMAANFHGVFVSLDSLELSPEGMPLDGSGVVALSSPAPAAVWSFAQAQVEQLRGMNLAVDGDPVQLPAELVPYPLPVQALMTARSLAVVVGEGNIDRARATAGVAEAGPHAVLRYGENGRFYSEVYAPLIERGMRDGMIEAIEKAEAAAAERAEADGESGSESGSDADAEQTLSREDAELIVQRFSDFMKQFGEALAYTEMRVLFTERGIEVHQDMRLR